MQTLTKAKVVKMKDLIEVAGIALDNADALAQRLEIKSTRTVHLLLKKWRENLSEEDWNFCQVKRFLIKQIFFLVW